MADIIDQIREFTDPELDVSIVGAYRDDNTDYYLVQQQGEFESALSLFVADQSGVQMLSADILGDPELDGTKLSILSRFRLGRRLLDWLRGDNDDNDPVDAQTPIQPQKPKPARVSAQELVNDKMFDTAVWGVNNPQMNSRTLSPKETQLGVFACAWAVNRIAKIALGRQIGGGLKTADMIQVLRQSHQRVSEANAVPGCVIISPTRAKVGHVGIYGGPGGIYSNSSRRGIWQRSHSLSDWKAYYVNKQGLDLYFFQLNPAEFPTLTS